MLKPLLLEKEFENRAANAVKAMFGHVPAVKLKDIKFDWRERDRVIDMVVHLNVSGRRQTIVCEAKSSGQPRHVRVALLQLREYLSHFRGNATGLVIAPYLSPEAQALCREYATGFLDFEGNARVAFNGVFIERLVASKPAAERRALKSIFKPKSAQVLRVMFRNPRHPWRVAKLAEATGVSLGHVSNVRAVLLDREWAGVTADGMSLLQPDALLDAWRDAYEPPSGNRVSFFTPLHGAAFDAAARKAVFAATAKESLAAFASFSAAQLLAPSGRADKQYFYADDVGLDQLQVTLKLSSATVDKNVVVIQPKDPGLLRDAVSLAPDVVCTSPVQTYLDLTAAGEQGRGVAEHLRREKLSWNE